MQREEIWSIRSNTLFDQIRDQWCRFKLALHPLNPQLISKVSFTRRLLRWRIAMTRWRPYYLIYLSVTRRIESLCWLKQIDRFVTRDLKKASFSFIPFSPFISIAFNSSPINLYRGYRFEDNCDTMNESLKYIFLLFIYIYPFVLFQFFKE